LWLAAGVLTCCLALAGWYWSSHDGPTYRTVTVERGDIEATVNALGTLQPVTAVDVGAQVSGQIVRLLVQPGDIVRKGQLLAEIDASIHAATVEAGRAEVAGLRARLADQQAQLDLARRQYARQQQMERDGATRAEDVDTASATLKSAEARAADLRAQIEETTSRLKGDEAQLGYTRIFAPIAGTVTSVDAKEGQTLNATYQTPPVLTIADLSRMTVWTEVSEADVRRVKPGMRAQFSTLGDDGRIWTGTIRQVLPAPPKPAGETATTEKASAAKAVHYTVLFDVANTDSELLPQMTAQVSILTARAHGVLVAPVMGLEPVDGAPGTYTAKVLDDRGRAGDRKVRGGVRDRMKIQVLEGLKGGDRLIVPDDGSAP
jgi:macrolide-specific efflux system membrane fusion protein